MRIDPQNRYQVFTLPIGNELTFPIDLETNTSDRAYYEEYYGLDNNSSLNLWNINEMLESYIKNFESLIAYLFTPNLETNPDGNNNQSYETCQNSLFIDYFNHDHEYYLDYKPLDFTQPQSQSNIKRSIKRHSSHTVHNIKHKHKQPQNISPIAFESSDIDSDFINPVAGNYRLTSGFGPRRQPTAGASTNHKGLDLAAIIGTTVVASRSGIVSFAGKSRGYGNLIIIDHGNGITTRYGHLSAMNVQTGDKVSQRQKIGEVGNEGVSTGPHLHFEIRKDEIAINPAKHIHIA